MSDIFSGKALADIATEYVATINRPANGWGQHVHPRYGASHNMMGSMFRAFGGDATNAAIAKEIERRRKEQTDHDPKT